MANKGLSGRPSQRRQGNVSLSRSKDVPIQVMVPEAVRRQVALMGADRGESIRSLVLRGLQAIGIDIPDSELGDRRGRRHSQGGHGNGAK
jgi:hypothetical protein